MIDELMLLQSGLTERFGYNSNSALVVNVEFIQII